MLTILLSTLLVASAQLEALKADWAAGRPTRPFLVTQVIEPCRGGEVKKLAVCIGGSGETLDSIYASQGRHFAAAGYRVLMVENPPDDIARICLERGSSWLYYGRDALVPLIDSFTQGRGHSCPRSPIVWSGFSLGTELMMATASVCARPGDSFVYNDFLCRCKERLIVLKYEPNGLRNITPSYYEEGDFPERMAKLAKLGRVIFTEGGLVRDLELVKSAAPENVTYFQQPKFAAAPNETLIAPPSSMDVSAYFDACNVDPANHYYKWELVEPWLNSK